MTLLKNTSYLSLFIQVVTGAIDLWGLTIKVPESARIFQQLLLIEWIVQIIEFIFYIWLVYHMNKKDTKIKNVTVYRYVDWIITTPSMLLTLMAYLNIQEDSSQPQDLLSFIKQNTQVIIVVWILNFLMLAFGLLGELGYMDERISALIGFVPFVLYYYIIYKKFIENKNISSTQRNVFYYFIIVWGLYGIAALLSYELKNSMYNILDLFSKNFFGLFLVYILYTKSKQMSTLK